MNNSMGAAIRRLTTIFLMLLLAISVVAAYVQVSDQAFFNGPALSTSLTFNANGHCPPYDAPVRGTIFDRNGVKLAWSVQDPKATCGYRRVYADPTLSPLLGYFSYKYGTAGIENTFDSYLSGAQSGDQLVNHLLHKPQYGNDLYLTIDDRLQKYINSIYNSSAITGNVCQPAGSDPPGAIVVEDTQQGHQGEILAMLSRPYYDANKIDQPGYFQSLQADGSLPLLNRAAQGLYDPGSTFKTVTLSAALNEGATSLSSTYSKQDAVYFTINGEPINWVDYINGSWQHAQFPLTVSDAYAFSDNTVYARLATQLGADTWLNYVRAFGISTPGQGMPTAKPLGFDAPYAQSQAFNALTNGKPTQFGVNLLAESGFGQGQLLISPLTMATVASAVAADGYLYTPHIALNTPVPHGTPKSDVLPQGAKLYSEVMRPETATAVRQAMWAVTTRGTGSAGLPSHNGYYTYNSPVHMGGKTGTAQTDQPNPETWWIGIAPDDAAGAGIGPAKYAIALLKENSGEGACQVYVANDALQYALQNNIGS